MKMLDFRNNSKMVAIQVASLREQALTSLEIALQDIRQMKSMSDDPVESKAAACALAFVDNGFAELTAGKPKSALIRAEANATNV